MIKSLNSCDHARHLSKHPCPLPGCSVKWEAQVPASSPPTKPTLVTRDVLSLGLNPASCLQFSGTKLHSDPKQPHCHLPALLDGPL